MAATLQRRVLSRTHDGEFAPSYLRRFLREIARRAANLLAEVLTEETIVKRLLLAGAITTLLISAAFAAEKLEDKAIKVSLDAPEAYIKAPELPAKDPFIGEAKGLFLS